MRVEVTWVRICKAKKKAHKRIEMKIDTHFPLTMAIGNMMVKYFEWEELKGMPARGGLERQLANYLSGKPLHGGIDYGEDEE